MSNQPRLEERLKEQSWQSIATCPSQTVLLWARGWRSPFVGKLLGDFGHCYIDGDPGMEMWGATHWKPCPPPQRAEL